MKTPFAVSKIKNNRELHEICGGKKMKLLSDYHTHTTYCDGKSTPREMIESACRMGFTDLGFSGHADFSFAEPGFGMSEEKLNAYLNEIRKLREEYADRIRIYAGIELDCLGPVQKAEYAIGSTHCVCKNGVYVSVDDTEEKLVDAVRTLWNGDWYAFVRDYFELEATIIDRMDCDWIGHFDLLTKFNENNRHFDVTRDEYREPALVALRRLNEAEIPFEINTGAISRGYRTEPYPSAFLLRELKSMGGRIMISSDSHHADTIGFAFDQALRLAVECGFDRITVLRPEGFREVEI